VFAGYRIESVLDRGGMGVVYRATDPVLKRGVALKIVAPEYTRDPAAVARFKNEARLAASLEHPNIVPVYGGGEYQGVVYLAMRLVPGTDLRHVITDGPVELPVIERVVSQVASALDAAHGRGLVHRDVKPANILLTGAGGAEHAYLADFGLTKQLGSSAGLTRTGAWVGTPDYVAPEQIQGQAVDGRSDVYSLGCVLYELLTGDVPYPRDSHVAKLWAHINDPPPSPRRRRPELPEAFDAVVARATAKRPADRYDTAGELAAALEAAMPRRAAARTHTAGLAPVPQPEPPVPMDAVRDRPAAREPPPRVRPAAVSRRRSPPPRRRRTLLLPMAAIAAVLAAVAAAIAVLGREDDRPQTPATADATQEPARTATGPFALAGGPDELAVGAGAVWVAESRAQRLTRIDPRTGATTSVRVGPNPDGVAVAFGSIWVSVTGADEVVQVSADARPKVLGRVKVGTRPEGLAASSNSIWVANSGAGTLTQIDPESRATRTVPRVAREPVAVAVGAGAVWVADRAGGALARVDGGRRRLADTIGGIGPDPRAVAIVGRDVWVATAADGRAWRVRADANAVAGSVRVGGSPRGLAADGRQLWVTDHTGDRLVEVDTTAMRVAASRAVAAGPLGVAADRRAVWVAGFDAGEVTRVPH
jgi:sugar lactone lactonase YvrE